jgi:hypothetical protein
MIHWTVDINWPGAKPPVWSLAEQEEIDTQRPTRDKILVESGAKLTRSYWMRTYDLEEDDLEPEAEPEPEPPPVPVPLPVPVGAASSREEPAPEIEDPEEPEEPAALAAPGSAGVTPADDPIAPQIDRIGAAAAPHIAAWVGHIRDRLDAAIARGDSPADFAAALLTLYPELPSAELTAVMGEALAAVNLAGRYDLDQGD